ncbi:hypothetical protein HDE_03331 [Halotydeus destructor]|nr:hypothetical protein HDE_03331 [Halotydeus destructor]
MASESEVQNSEPESSEIPAVPLCGNVRNLALFFQSRQNPNEEIKTSLPLKVTPSLKFTAIKNEISSIYLPKNVEEPIQTPALENDVSDDEPVDAYEVPKELEEAESLKHQLDCLVIAQVEKPAKTKPVPRPRLSIIRKRWYKELILDSEDSSQAGSSNGSSNNYGHVIEETDNYDNACGASSSSGKESVYNEIHEIAEEAIYEELPSRPSSSCATEKSAKESRIKDRAKSVDRLRSSIGLIFQKSRRLSNKLPERQIRRTLSAFARSCDTLLSDLPSKPTRSAPRPPSVEQLLNRPRLPDPSSRGYANYSRVLPESCKWCEQYSQFKLHKQGNANKEFVLESLESEDDYDAISRCISEDSDDLYDDIEEPCSASDRIYESLKCDNSRLSKDTNGNVQLENNEYQNDAVFRRNSSEKKLCREQKKIDKKRVSLAHKLKKKFNVTGREVPVNWGLVKEDAPKTRHNIKVIKGETVLVIRMEGNPPGKWLAKNERGKIGYVELSNVAFDPDSVKTLMTLNTVEAIDPAYHEYN